MGRALTVFGVLVFAVLFVGWFARAILHLGCLGPVIEGWGCLATPYPDVLPGNSVDLYYFGVAVVVLASCYVVKDLVWSAAGFFAGRLFPRWAHRAAVDASETATQRGYRIR